MTRKGQPPAVGSSGSRAEPINLVTYKGNGSGGGAGLRYIALTEWSARRSPRGEKQQQQQSPCFKSVPDGCDGGDLAAVTSQYAVIIIIIIIIRSRSRSSGVASLESSWAPSCILQARLLPPPGFVWRVPAGSRRLPLPPGGRVWRFGRRSSSLHRLTMGFDSAARPGPPPHRCHGGEAFNSNVDLRLLFFRSNPPGRMTRGPRKLSASRFRQRRRRRRRGPGPRGSGRAGRGQRGARSEERGARGAREGGSLQCRPQF